MNFSRAFFFFFFLMTGVAAEAQLEKNYTLVKDLRHDWMIHEHDAWKPWDGKQASVIYLSLPASSYKGKFIELRSPAAMTLFLNQKLILERSGTILLNADSLGRLYSPLLTIGLFQKNGIDLRGSALVFPFVNGNQAESPLVPHKDHSFLNFAIIGALVLAASFILLLRTNPRLTLDYMNVPRLFAIQEREDNLLTTRLTSSVNLLFYLFCSAFFAFNLLAVFYFGADDGGPKYFPVHSTMQGFFQWGKLMAIVAGCLILKLAIIYSFSTMFKLRDTSALQFFNFIRMILFISIVISLVSLCYFIFYGYPAGPHFGLLKVTTVIMSVSAAMVFLKLLTLAPFRFFHLFSYLCASEIIPLVIFLRILLS